MRYSELLLALPSRLDAELLLAHILKKPKEYLFAHGEEEISPQDLKTYHVLVEKRRQGMPIAYLVHEKEFFGRRFYVDERVLIPRPETELMVEDALKFLREHPEIKTVIDLGTGSGCIGITIALELPDRKVIGLDISSQALEVANKNAKDLGCKSIEFTTSDLLSELKTMRSSMAILANLPYIGTKSNHFISQETHRYEPHLATYGGPDGLELYRRTWKQIKRYHLSVVVLFMEIGFSQKETLNEEVRDLFPDARLEIKEDLSGFPRTAILLATQFHQQREHKGQCQKNLSRP